MHTFRLNLTFTGVDFDDDETFEALAEFPDISWRAQGTTAYATATVDATSALKAVEAVIEQVGSAVPVARAVAIDEDLVGIPDIAARAGVSREAVRNWADGRRQAGFPLPRGTVGDAIRVWAWSEVNAWLLANLSLGDEGRFLTQREVGLINDVLQGRHRPTEVEALTSWRPARHVTTSAEARSFVVGSHGTWVHSRLGGETVTLVSVGDRAAA